MSLYFKYTGYLEFSTAAEAGKYYDILTKAEESWFSFVPPGEYSRELEIAGKKLKFKNDGNFNNR